jgi:hypothetical protein
LLHYKDNVNSEKYFEIEVIDLAEFVKNLNRRIKVVKLDVEGVECSILNRLIDTGIIRNIEVLLVETHENKIPELRECTAKLRQRIIDEMLGNIYLDWI